MNKVQNIGIKAVEAVELISIVRSRTPIVKYLLFVR